MVRRAVESRPSSRAASRSPTPPAVARPLLPLAGQRGAGEDEPPVRVDRRTRSRRRACRRTVAPLGYEHLRSQERWCRPRRHTPAYCTATSGPRRTRSGPSRARTAHRCRGHGRRAGVPSARSCGSRTFCASAWPTSLPGRVQYAPCAVVQESGPASSTPGRSNPERVARGQASRSGPA